MMKKYGVLLIIIAGMVTSQGYAMSRLGGSTSNLQGATTDAELQEKLAEAEAAKNAFIEKATKVMNSWVGVAKSAIDGSAEILSINAEKLQKSFDGLQNAANADIALTKLVEALNIMKNTGMLEATSILASLEESYEPLAASALITEQAIKNRIDSAIIEVRNIVSSYKKAFPSQVKRGRISTEGSSTGIQSSGTGSLGGSIKEALKEAGTELAKVGISVGLGALVDLITGKKTLSEADKNKLISATKVSLKVVDDIKESINEAASVVATELGRLRTIDTDAIEAMKNAFKLQVETSYASAPDYVKFDMLVKGYHALADALQKLGNALKATENGIVKFLSNILGEEDDKVAQLASSAMKLNKTIALINQTIENSTALVEETKVKFSKKAPTPKTGDEGTSRTETTPKGEKGTTKSEPKTDRKAWSLSDKSPVSNPISGQTYYGPTQSDAINNKTFVW